MKGCAPARRSNCRRGLLARWTAPNAFGGQLVSISAFQKRASPENAPASGPRPCSLPAVSLRAYCRGWLGEQTARLHMRWWLDESVYRRVDNVIIPDQHGSTPHDSRNKAIWFLIDGQQRLSVLYRAKQGHEVENDQGRKLNFSNCAPRARSLYLGCLRSTGNLRMAS